MVYKRRRRQKRKRKQKGGILGMFLGPMNPFSLLKPKKKKPQRGGFGFGPLLPSQRSINKRGDSLVKWINRGRNIKKYWSLIKQDDSKKHFN